MAAWRARGCSRSTSSRRPRIDVVISLSGIFRDLLPLQIKLLAEAAFLAASADEPIERNFVRKHALGFLEAHGGDIETAALRVFGNAEGAYGSNVGNLIESGRWERRRRVGGNISRAAKASLMAASGAPVQQLSCSRACSPASISPIRISTLSNSA